ncbi:hypothetical protein AHAS_Ahas09G0021900 [Arachis hypogaea]
MKRDKIARQNHALNIRTVTYGRLFHFFDFFHFSRRFQNNETLSFSSENQVSKYRNRSSKTASKHHQPLCEESKEKTNQEYSTENGSKKPN